MAKTIVVLYCRDQGKDETRVLKALSDLGTETEVARGSIAVIRALSTRPYDVLVADLEENSLEASPVLAALRSPNQDTPATACLGLYERESAVVSSRDLWLGTIDDWIHLDAIDFELATRMSSMQCLTAHARAGARLQNIGRQLRGIGVQDFRDLADLIVHRLPLHLTVADLLSGKNVYFDQDLPGDLGYVFGKDYNSGEELGRLVTTTEYQAHIRRRNIEVETLGDGEAVSGEILLKAKSGELIPYLERVSVLQRDEAGKPTHVLRVILPSSK